MTTTTLDPTAIRIELEFQRRLGRPFDEAWKVATRGNRADRVNERSLYSFMERNFRAAYSGTPSSLGRCNVPERDTSDAAQNGVVARPAPSLDHERCQSADGCDHLATRGRFGKVWCEHHGAELERIQEKYFPGGGFGNGRSPAARCG